MHGSAQRNIVLYTLDVIIVFSVVKHFLSAAERKKKCQLQSKNVEFTSFWSMRFHSISNYSLHVTWVWCPIWNTCANLMVLACVCISLYWLITNTHSLLHFRFCICANWIWFSISCYQSFHSLFLSLSLPVADMRFNYIQCVWMK